MPVETPHPSKWAAATEHARLIPESRLATEPLESLLQEMLENGGPRRIDIDFGARYSLPQDGAFELRYPARGDVGRLHHNYSSSGDRHELEFQVSLREGATFTSAELAETIAAFESRLRDQQQAANDDIERDIVEFCDAVRAVLEPRWKTSRMLRGALAELNIPLTKTPGASLVPVSPAPLSLTAITESAAGGTPEWVLEDRLAEGVVETVAAFARSLERSPSAAARLVGGDEETLRDVLLCVLNGAYQGMVTGETFIGDGKSDLLLRWRDRDAFVGECKMWRGAALLEAGVEQLLSRYTLWRQARVALVVFFDRASDATALISKATDVLSSHPRTLRVIDAAEPTRRSDYEVNANGDGLRLARLSLLPVVLRRPVADGGPTPAT